MKPAGIVETWVAVEIRASPSSFHHQEGGSLGTQKGGSLGTPLRICFLPSSFPNPSVRWLTTSPDTVSAFCLFIPLIWEGGGLLIFFLFKKILVENVLSVIFLWRA